MARVLDAIGKKVGADAPAKAAEEPPATPEGAAEPPASEPAPS
jgi:hypothetical protein